MVTGLIIEQEVLERDLTILREMVNHLDEYLFRDVEHWDMGKQGMPPMTIGGCLMRLRRLSLLQDHLYESERSKLAEVRDDFEAALAETVVRFEQRAYQELSARLREWTNYLRNLSSSASIAGDREMYAGKVDTRIVVGELVDKLGQHPYHLDGRVPRDVAAVDRRMRLMWEPGSFVLAPVWALAYPRETYWWLYGNPKS
ncbi:MAG: hypothetical protein R6X18_12170 [Chloroflexota bacterium]|jgi:hypothetical protein